MTRVSTSVGRRLACASGCLLTLASTAGAQRVSSPGSAFAGDLLAAEEGACQPDWLPTFGTIPGIGAGGAIRAITTFDDGSGLALYVVGNSLQIPLAPADSVAKWDGVRWTVLGSGLSSTLGTTSPRALHVFDDGTGAALYVGGYFTHAGGVPAGGVAKWDGMAWSAVGTGVGISPSFSGVRSFETFDDGTGGGPALYAAGGFTQMDGLTVDNIAKWDGASWTSLSGGLTGGLSFVFPVLDAEVFDDGNGPALFVGGSFHDAGGVAVSNLAKWDGVAWSSPGGGLFGLTPDFVSALATFDDGAGPALYAAGDFATAGAVSAKNIARWNGASWSALGSGVSVGTNALLTHDDGSGEALYAAGAISIAGGQPVNKIAKWDGSTWSPLGKGIETPQGSGPVYVLGEFESELGAGAELYACGLFTLAGGVNTIGIARWDGSDWFALGLGLNGQPHALLTSEDSSGSPVLYAGGRFRTAGGVSARLVAKWDGTTWSPLGTGFDGENVRKSGHPEVNRVQALAVFDDGTGSALYAGGSFKSANGVAVNGIAKWDGTSWQPLGSGMSAGLATAVYALGVFDDGTGPALYAGGEFTFAGGVLVSNIAKWDGVGWSSLGIGTNARVHALEVFDDGPGPALYVAGHFWMAGGMVANRVARWDGTSWSNLNPAMPGQVVSVNVLAAHDDGTGYALYAGGDFTNAGGVPAARVAKWDGSSWSQLGSGVGSHFLHQVWALQSFDDGNGALLHVGGCFDVAGGVSVSGYATWDGTAWSAYGPGLISPFTIGGSFVQVRALAQYDDGAGEGNTLVVGGLLSSADDPPDSFLVRFTRCRQPEPSVTYCTGKTNSLGCVPFLTTTGIPSATETGAFRILANDTINEAGRLWYSFKKSNLNFHGAKLCIRPPLQPLTVKTPKQNGVPPCERTLSRNFNARIQSGIDPQLTPGQAVYAQWRGRDPQEPQGFGDMITNAVMFTIAP